jgi:putative membrane protein
MRQATKAGRFFSDDERERLRDATREAESKTIGEVAVVVSDRSDEYPEAGMLGGVLLGGLIALVLVMLFFHSSLWFYIPLNLLLFFPVRALLVKVPALRTAFIGRGRIEAAVRQAALRAFYDKGLYKTKGHTGVLFFLSLLERKVWVLADRGIHEKIKQESLNKLAGQVSRGIREGRACDALCEAISEAGELLACHFPITPDDTNELPDDVMTE